MSPTQSWRDELLPSVFRKEAAATEQFVLSFSPLLRSIVQRILGKYGSHTGKAPLVEDLLQDILFCLFDKDCYRLRQFNPDRGSLKTFLVVIARRYAVDQLRSRGYGGRLESLMANDELFAYAAADWEAFDRLAARQWWRTIREKLVPTLSPEDLLILERSFEDEASGAELAALLDTTEGAVHARRSRLRKRIIALIEEYAGAADEPLGEKK